ncbi:MAG: hypothetical protein K2O42_04605 [Oscillospiraceae bacterium]|nr:hypothetical protein [Oscillospiraceae bacterium]
MIDLKFRLKLNLKFICCLLLFITSLVSSVILVNLHAVRKQVITVWMPLPDSMTEQDAQNTWERLTDHFEELYPDFGIALSVYVDSVPSDAEAPVMWINPPAKTDIPKADLSEILQRLDPAYYIPDFPEYLKNPDQVPLSWNIPVVYSSDLEHQGKIIDKNQLPADLDADFNAFLENPQNPVLSDSSRLAMIERTPRTSGAVCMIPVTENNLFEIQYQDYCIINADADKNSQKIAVLWIGYLLSEQAQQILYTEHYGNFPVQKSALSETFSQHQALSVVADLASARGDFL